MKPRLVTAPAAKPRAPRTLRARAPIAIAPLCVSTENCLPVAGVLPWKLRSMLEEHPDVKRSRVGQTLILSAEDFFTLLDRYRVQDGAETSIEPETDDADQPKSIDDVLAKLGREVAR